MTPGTEGASVRPWFRAPPARMPFGDAAGSPKRMTRSHLCQIGAASAPNVGSWVGMDSASRGLFCFGVRDRLAGQLLAVGGRRRF